MSGRNKLLTVAIQVIVLVIVLTALATGSEQARRPVSFPSTQTEAISSDRRFAVVNVDSVDSDTEPHHTLFLENRQTKTRHKLLEYGRQVEVLWNPNSKSFAVTDYAGSNVAECLVFFVSDDGKRRNVADALLSTITNPKELASLRDSSHIYWAAVRWKSPRSLLVTVSGHTDAAPARNFRYFHTYNLSNSQ